MERSAVEPGDQQGAVLAQGAVDVGGGQALGSSPNREPGATRVLALDREQALGDRDRVRQRGRQALGLETFGEGSAAQLISRRSTTKISVSFFGIAGGLPAAP